MAEPRSSFRLKHSLILIPLIYGILNINQVFALGTVTEWLNALILLVLFVFTFFPFDADETRRWNGYRLVIPIIAWIVLNAPVAIWLLLIGLVVQGVFIYRQTQRWEFLHASLNLMAILGISVLVAVTTYQIFGGTATLQPAEMPLNILALLTSGLVAGVLHMLYNNISWADQWRQLQHNGLEEWLFLLAAPATPLLIQQMSVVSFWLILALLAVLTFQRRNFLAAQTSLGKHSHDITTIHELGRLVANNYKLDDILSQLHIEISQLIDYTTFFVALYDDEYGLIEYPFVHQDGVVQNNTARTVDNELVAYVIKSRKLLVLKKTDTERIQQLALNANNLEYAVCLCAPLAVGEKTIGVMSVAHRDNPNAFSDEDIDLLQAVASQASLVLRNANLYERTNQLAQNLSKINTSLQDVMFNLDKDDALQTACEIAMRVTSAQFASIYLLQPTRDTQMALVQTSEAESNRLPKNITYRPELYQQGPRIIRSDDSNGADTITELAQYHSSVQIPLRSGTTMIGCLVVYHERLYRVESTELSLLEMLANQITAALDNADLLQALELYAAEQAQLVHLSRISSTNLDLERIIQDVCALLQQMVDMPFIQIGLHQPEQQMIHIYEPDIESSRIQLDVRAVTAIPEIAMIIDGRNYANVLLFFADQPHVSDELKQYMAALMAHTMVFIPMRINQQSIGVIMLADTSVRMLSDNEYRLLEMAAHQVSAQVHNARIHMLTEEALVQRLEQLALIEEIAQQISQALDLELIIDNVLDAGLQATQANLAAIALPVPNSDMMQVIWKEDPKDGEITRHERLFKPFGGIVGYIMSSGETLLIPDNREFENYYAPNNWEYLSTLAVPLRKGDEIIGVLNLESTQLNFFTSEHGSFIKSLAGHAAISIDNANLLKEREQQINALTLLRALSLETLTIMEKRRIAQSILRVALIILNGDACVLYTRDHMTNDLTPIVSLSATKGRVSPANITVPQPILDAAIVQHDIYMVEDTFTHPLYRLDGEDASLHRSLVVLPIHRRGTITELIVVLFEEPRTISKQDRNTLDLLVVQAAGQLENAALNDAILTSNNRMRAILDATRDGIILLDNQDRIQDSNLAAETLLNISLQTHQAQIFGDVLLKEGHPDLQQIVTTYQADHESINEQEYSIAKGTEDAIYLKTLMSPVQDANGQIIGHLLILRDITEEKELEDFRDKIQRMVVHDLRGPLSAIITSMYLSINIIDYPGEVPLQESLVPTLKVSLESANNLMNLVETLRDLPKIPHMEIVPQAMSVREFAEDAYNSLSASIVEANITVDYPVENNEYNLYVDADLIRRVFINLLHNAFKFTPEDGRIKIAADFETEQEGFMRITISDTGPGIPEEHRDRIFAQFIQIEGRRPRAGGKGTGLGLNFCKLAIEAHGGQIWVEPNGFLSGACFAFTLPYYAGSLHPSGNEQLPLIE